MPKGQTSRRLVRRELGARRRDVLVEFVTEAMVLSAAGPG